MRRAFYYICFFCTGVFALVYEVVWSRYLALMVGNAAHAYIAVLAAYMGGLAAGAVLFGRLADSLSDNCKAYGWLETGVGAYAIAFPKLFAVLERVMLPIGQAIPIGTTAMSAFKFAFALACLLPPTILMGGTLPILIRGLTASTTTLRRNVAGLYGLNSAGAVIGCLLAGFYFVETWGLPGTMAIIGSLNALLGVTAVLVGAPRPKGPDAASAPAAEATLDTTVYPEAMRRAALLLAAFSGFAGLALETVWIRYFTLALGSSANAFSIILAAFITGIALGSLGLSSRFYGRQPLLRVLLFALLGSAVFFAVTLEFYDRLPYDLWRIRTLFRPSPASYRFYQVLAYGACFLCMFVPTLAAGLVFPATIRLASQADRLGRGVGRIYAVNTVGAVAGAMATGLVLFSWIGFENILRSLLVAYALAALLLALRFAERRRVAWIGAAVVVIVGHLVVYRPIPPLLLNLGFYYRSDEPPPFADFRRMFKDQTVKFVAEGPHATVIVRDRGLSNIFRDQPHRLLAVNGKVDASNGLDMITQVLLAHVPMMLHENPRDAFVVGLGSGVSAGSALTYGGNVVVAEISREVVRAERLFEPFNNQPLANPRCRLVLEDAKTILKYEPMTYDVIISEPTNPWIAGIAGLFSQEFYATAKSRLNPGGVFAQWAPAYKTSDETMSDVVATLLDAFRYVYVFQSIPGDYIFTASDRPLRLDPARLEARFRRPELAADLQRIHAANAVVFLSTEMKDARRVRFDFAGGRINSDYFPRMEYRAPASLFFDHNSALVASRDDRRYGDDELLLAQYCRSRPLAEADVRAMAGYWLNVDGANPEVVATLWRMSRKYLGEEAGETHNLFQSILALSPVTAAVEMAAAQAPPNPATVSAEGRLALLLKDYAGTWSGWMPADRRLVDAADWLDAHGANDIDRRFALLREVCRRGLAEACETQARRLEPALAGSAEDRANVAAARFECAVRRWDEPTAAAQLAVIESLVAPTNPTLRELEAKLARLHEVRTFYASDFAAGAESK